MDHSEEVQTVSEVGTKRGKSRSKRKWREIEALKERYELKKELDEIDFFQELDVEDLEF